MYDCVLSILHLKNKLNWTELWSDCHEWLPELFDWQPALSVNL